MLARQPPGRPFAADDRRRARRVRSDAGGSGNADRAPAGVRGHSGAGFDDVMQPGCPSRPGPDLGGRGGQAPAADGYHGVVPGRAGPGRNLGLGTGRGTVESPVVHDPDQPALVRWLARHRDVAAQVDQSSAVHRGGDPCRRAVGGQGLGRRPQVEHDSARDPDFAPFTVEVHGPPPRRGYCGPRQWAGVPPGRSEVAVIAEPRQRAPTGRIHIAVGGIRCGERRRHGLGQQCTDPHRPPMGVIDPP